MLCVHLLKQTCVSLVSQGISLEREEIGKPEASTDKHDLDTSVLGG